MWTFGRRILLILAVLLCVGLCSSPAQAKQPPIVPDFSMAKVQEDIHRATREGYDPYFVLGHIAAESGTWAVGAWGKVYGTQSDTHTYVKNRSGDYGRHQINCGVWKSIQRLHKAGIWYKDFPKDGTIRRCRDLYDDGVNRAAYYYILDLIEDTRVRRKTRKKVNGVPIWVGYYQSGYKPPKRSYVKRIGKYKKLFRNWRKQVDKHPSLQKAPDGKKEGELPYDPPKKSDEIAWARWPTG